MLILLMIILIPIGTMNLFEGASVFSNGWIGRSWKMFFGHMDWSTGIYSYHWSGLKDTVLWFLTLPGALLGLVFGIITFQWTHW